MEKIDEKKELEEQEQGGMLTVETMTLEESQLMAFSDVKFDERLAKKNIFRKGDTIRLKKLNRRLKRIRGANLTIEGKVLEVFDDNNAEVTFLDTSPMRFPVKIKEIVLVEPRKDDNIFVRIFRKLKHKLRK